MQVGLLTISQKDELIGQYLDENTIFNPIQDLDENWIIGIEEIEQCNNEEFLWVKNLPLIDWKPKLEN